MLQAVEAVIRDGRIQPVEPIGMKKMPASCSSVCNPSPHPQQRWLHNEPDVIPEVRKAV